MASYDRSIPPGGEGKITLTVNTQGYQGRIQKDAFVHTTDPGMARFTVGITAFVQVPISVSPRFVALKGDADKEVSKTVKIVAGLEKPLLIEEDRSRLEGKVRYEIQEVEKGRTYLVRFTSIPGNTGPFSGFLNLKTNYDERPVLNIPVRATFTLDKTRQEK